MIAPGDLPDPPGGRPRRQQRRQRGIPRLVGVLVPRCVGRVPKAREQFVGVAPDRRGLAFQVADVHGQLRSGADGERFIDRAEQVAPLTADV